MPYLNLKVILSLFGLALLRDAGSGALFVRRGNRLRRMWGRVEYF